MTTDKRRGQRGGSVGIGGTRRMASFSASGGKGIKAGRERVPSILPSCVSKKAASSGVPCRLVAKRGETTYQDGLLKQIRGEQGG